MHECKEEISNNTVQDEKNYSTGCGNNVKDWKYH